MVPNVSDNGARVRCTMPRSLSPNRSHVADRARQVMMPSHRLAVPLFAALFSAFAISAGGALAQTTVTSEPPASFTLGNGLQVVVIPDHRTPVVTQMIWYKVGSADETPGKSGLAHFLEHLMFKGTSKHPAGEFSQTVLRIGGNENAFTSTDYTGYFQRVPREQLGQDDGVRGRSHDRPDPEGRKRAAGARRRARRIQHAGRQQPGGAADRADHGGAVSQSSLWPPRHRLASGNREARPRRCAGVLQALLCAEQRDPGDRRRRRRHGCPPDGGADLRRESRHSPRYPRSAFGRRSRSRPRRAP